MLNESRQWEKINKLAPKDLDSWEEFKRSDFFYKITVWNPMENGVRYLKMLLYNLGKNLSEDELLILDKITNRNIGRPYCVNIEGRDIDFDYLQAAYEINTLYNTIPKYQLGTLLEIGAGYGRTYHSILCNYPDVKEYIILDASGISKFLITVAITLFTLTRFPA